MDLYITVKDEDGAVLYERNIYRDGSDSVGAERIADALDYEFGGEYDEDDGQPDEAQEWHDFDPDC